MRTTLAAAVVAVIVLGAAGCREDGDGADGTTPASSSPASRSAGPTSPSFQVTETIKVQDAAEASPGRQFRPLFVSSGTASGGRTMVPLAVTTSGKLVVAANPPARTGAEQVEIGQSEVGYADRSGFARFPAAPTATRDRPRQAGYAAVRDGTVAWVETASTNLYVFDWRVYTYDHTARTTRLLGDSAALAPAVDLPWVAGSPAPSVGATTVYWATPYPISGDARFGVKIVSRQASGDGALETAVDHAKLPAAAGTDLYYVRSADVSPGFAENRYEIRKLAAGGADSLVAAGPLDGGRQVTVLAMEGSRVNWVVSAPEQDQQQPEAEPTAVLYSLDLTRNQALAFALGHAGPSTMLLSVTPTLIAFAGGSAAGDAGQYVYDLARRRLWRLGSAEGLSVIYATGNAIAWSELPATAAPQDPARFRVAKWTGG